MSPKDFHERVAEVLTHASLAVSGEGLPAVTAQGKVDDRLVAYTQPGSLDAEYFSYLAIKLEQVMGESPEDGPGKVLLVTGPSRGSGKTLCALNLALTFAKAYGRKVCLLDADCRAASAQAFLGMGKDSLPGLTDVLRLSRNPSSVLVNSGLYDMVFFPSGPYDDEIPRRLREENLSLLLKNLCGLFRLVVVDTPPVFPMPEAGILARKADGVLLVLRAGKDGEPQLAQCLDTLQGAPLVGAVLNGIEEGFRVRSHYGGYYPYGARRRKEPR